MVRVIYFLSPVDAWDRDHRMDMAGPRLVGAAGSASTLLLMPR